VTESGSVGAWDSGPFDNDDAADFAGQLDEADQNQRIEMIRDALRAGADGDDEAFPRAVAAAAVLAATRADIPVDWSYAPKFDVGGLDVADDLVELAVLALDAVADSDSEYAELFGEAGTLETLRSALIM
jgi:hypothetical protein